MEDRVREARRQAELALPRPLTLLAQLLDCVNLGMSQLSGDHDRQTRLLRMLLLNRAYNSLYRSREDALCGFATQSMALMRCALEDWGTAEYVTTHPETSYAWLKEVIEEAFDFPGGIPSFKDIWAALPQALVQPVDTLYSDLSALAAHPRPAGMSLQYHVDEDGAGVTFNAGPYFDLQQLRNCVGYLIILSACVISSVEKLHKAAWGAANEEWAAVVVLLLPQVPGAQQELLSPA